MKILIVGGTSSLGKELKPVLAEFAEITTAGRKDCDIYLDLNSSSDTIEIPQHFDIVINTAAHFGGRDFNAILAAEEVNVLGALKLCQACIKSEVNKIISISTILAGLSERSNYYSSYSLTKKQSDEIVQLFCSSFNLPCTILRPSQLYGGTKNTRTHQHFLYGVVDKAEKGEDINIYGCHDALRNYLHMEDLTKIISLVIKKEIVGLYTCTNSLDVSFSQIAQAAIDAFCSVSRIVFLKDREDIQDNIFPYDETLYQKISYFPQISIEEGMKKIATYRTLQL